MLEHGVNHEASFDRYAVDPIVHHLQNMALGSVVKCHAHIRSDARVTAAP